MHVDDDGEDTTDSHNNVHRIERVCKSLPEWVWYSNLSGGVIFRSRAHIPEPDCEKDHLDASYCRRQAVQKIIIGECLAGLDQLVTDEDAEHNLNGMHQ